MYEEINRFIGHPDQAGNFNSFFGTEQWKLCVSELLPRARNRCLHDLYLRQLRSCARFVRSFEMSNKRDVTDYFLFYATNELLGLRKMKEAMWKVDESGEFRFSDTTDPNQAVLFEKAPDFAALRSQIMQEFSGKDAKVRNIEHFVLLQTAFRETHYKGLLKTIEREGGLRALNPPLGRKIGTFADPDMVVRLK